MHHVVLAELSSLIEPGVSTPTPSVNEPRHKPADDDNSKHDAHDHGEPPIT
jgi:hypothetical protein